MKVRVAGLSDVGRCRKVNQDMFLLDDALGLYAIADGMGGHAAGEVASDLAITALAASLREREPGDAGWSPGEAGELLAEALNQGNRKICDSVQARPEWRGMGTTIVALVLTGGRAVIGHVGDSRAYLLRDGNLSQLTSDHSWVNEQVKLGLLTPEQAHRHPMRNIVTRALGNQPHVEVDLLDEEIQPGDVFALCSDGLSGMLGDDAIRDLLAEHGSVPQRACQNLVDQANARGGEDNITVIVMARDA
jgi:protein phosphatase